MDIYKKMEANDFKSLNKALSDADWPRPVMVLTKGSNAMWEQEVREAVVKMAEGYRYGPAYYNQDIFIEGLFKCFALCGVKVGEEWEDF